MLKKKNLKWHNPLELAFAVSEDHSYKENWAFLYSGLYKENPDSYSYLALYPQKQIIAENFTELEEALKNSDEYWFGYLGYDLKNYLEKLQTDKKSSINLPNLWMINYGLILEFNHQKQQLCCFFKDQELLKKIPDPLKIKSLPITKISALKSNFNKENYFRKLATIQSKIGRGDLYQANLTRKFFGKLSQKPKNIFSLFIRLNKTSPANYSSFLKLNKSYIISSSPELFLSVDKNNQVISKPIKGTAPRSNDRKLDILNKKNLEKSPKEKAENLMIVDLVRNDLSKNCLVGSVSVKNLFKISSYKNIHHMSSEIFGIKDKKYSTLEVVKNCFPPASMTGTPKIKAMEVCSNSEKLRRGIYSGAIGFFCKKTICKLSVVIRTIIIQDKKFEFQVGGAITFDSDPNKEWQETINKAKGIAKTLNIKLGSLKKL
jgi:para-aminobenzoate synthetase component 1